MTERPTNEEREAMIAGDRAGSLEADEGAELALLADLLAHPSTWAEPSAGLEEAIFEAVVNAGPTATISVMPSTPGPRHTAASWRRVLSARGRLVLSAAAVIAIVIGAVVAARGSASPDFKAKLTATALAPGASASVDITHNKGGFRIRLDARRLGPLPAGEYYQAWLKNTAGTLVPIGTFSSSGDPVTLWSGVSPKDFPSITVTIEASDNDQASSGRRVLAGEVQPG